jgi:hypothetical protein
MGKHLELDEARAVLTLSTDPNWQIFKGYIQRKYIIARNNCETARDDHRFFQGNALELKELQTIEDKAKNILEGT